MGAVAFAAGGLLAADRGPARGGEDTRTISPPPDFGAVERALDELRRDIAMRDDPLVPVPARGGREAFGGDVAVLLERLDRLEALITDSALASDSGSPRTRRSWRTIENDVRSLRRPTDIAEIRRFHDEHREDFDFQRVPFVLSLMGVRDVIDRFGWPESIEVHGTGMYELVYRLHPETEDMPGTLRLLCTSLETRSVVVQFDG